MESKKWSAAQLSAVGLRCPIQFSFDDLKKLPPNQQLYLRGPKSLADVNRFVVTSEVLRNRDYWLTLLESHNVTFCEPVYPTEGIVVYKQSDNTLVEGCIGYLAGLLEFGQLAYRMILESDCLSPLLEETFLQHSVAEHGSAGTYAQPLADPPEMASIQNRFSRLISIVLPYLDGLKANSILEILISDDSPILVDGKTLHWKLPLVEFIQSPDSRIYLQKAGPAFTPRWCPVLTEAWPSRPCLKPGASIVCRRAYPLLSHLLTGTATIEREVQVLPDSVAV